MVCASHTEDVRPFARNERVVCVFDSTPHAFSMVLVGALFVGSISTVWHGEITPPTRRDTRELTAAHGRATHLVRGSLMGWPSMENEFDA